MGVVRRDREVFPVCPKPGERIIILIFRRTPEQGLDIFRPVKALIIIGSANLVRKVGLVFRILLYIFAQISPFFMAREVPAFRAYSAIRLLYRTEMFAIIGRV